MEMQDLNQPLPPRERFRKSFVLLVTVACAILFLALIWGFVEALLLAAVFAGILHPMYRRLQRSFGGRSTLASLTTVLAALLIVVIPLIFLLGLVGGQAVEVAESMAPWVEQNIGELQGTGDELPDWFPYREYLQPYQVEIYAKLAEVAEAAAGYLAAGLGTVTEGAMSFFLQLFVMLYAMFFFLVSGPQLLSTILGYMPLSLGDADRLTAVSLSVSRATVKGTLVIGIIQGALGGIGFAVVGIGSPVFWAAVMAVLSILPGIGATLVWAPAVVYLLLTGHTLAGIGLLVWSAGVVGTIDNVLRPILVGRDTAMPDLLILLSTLGGLGLFGISGLVLGPMIAALFLAVLAIYSRVFGDWLTGPTEEDVIHDEVKNGN